MCGIVGFSADTVTEHDIQTLKKILIESQIRGKHASGIAWFDGKCIKSYIKPVPISELVENFDFSKLLYNNSSVAMIAHARYSTSDIKYNQPIVGKRLAIAHNGVITQDSPENWESTYGLSCKTKNDSELLLRALENKKDLESMFPESSIAMVILDTKGNVIPYRNHIRPLWGGQLGHGTIIASTCDILKRCGITTVNKFLPYFGLEQQRRDITQWIKNK